MYHNYRVYLNCVVSNDFNRQNRCQVNFVCFLSMIIVKHGGLRTIYVQGQWQHCISLDTE